MEKITIKKILDTIDLSKMENGEYYDMFSECFDIHSYLDINETRLTYCYYNSWICTDSLVGIKVWYFDDKPVCISWKPYRKSTETFSWISEEDFNKVKDYAYSFYTKDIQCDDISTDDIIDDVIVKFSNIEYKQFEKINIK